MIGFDYWPEIRRREQLRQAPESIVSAALGGGIAAAFVCAFGAFLLLVGA